MTIGLFLRLKVYKVDSELFSRKIYLEFRPTKIFLLMLPIPAERVEEKTPSIQTNNPASSVVGIFGGCFTVK